MTDQQPVPPEPPRRFPQRVFGTGSDPDARFTLANERTFLAWLSTGLALLSVGVGLEALGLGLQPQLRKAASVLLIACGIASPIQAWFGWTAVERAMREGRPLPAPRLGPWLVVALAVIGVLVLLGVLWGR